MKIGLCTGCFDRYHAGHDYFIEEAGKLCDYLIIAINNDNSVWELKGWNRPFEPLKRRVRKLNAVWDDVAVIPFDGDDAALALAIRPDLIIRGWDQSEKPSTFPVVRIGRGPNISTSSRA